MNLGTIKVHQLNSLDYKNLRRRMNLVCHVTNPAHFRHAAPHVRDESRGTSKRFMRFMIASQLNAKRQVKCDEPLVL
jgi:hypothetical protein